MRLDLSNEERNELKERHRKTKNPKKEHGKREAVNRFFPFKGGNPL
mgnify:CR=1 FL=1